MRAKKLTVCLITYNHKPYIARAIESILMQETNFLWEIIVADDFSTDGTRDILQSYADHYPDLITLMLQPQNIGPARNFEMLITAPESEYIAYLEGDDFWTDPLKLQKQFDFLEANPDYVVTYHDAITVDENENVVESEFLPLDEVHKKEKSQRELKEGAWLLTLSLCFRNVLPSLPPEMNTVFNGDTFFISLLGNHGKGKFLDDIRPACYRVHSGGVWSAKSQYNKLMPICNTYLWLERYYKRIHDGQMVTFFNRMRFVGGMKVLGEALRLDSFSLILKSYINLMLKCGTLLSKERIKHLHLTIFRHYRSRFNDRNLQRRPS